MSSVAIPRHGCEALQPWRRHGSRGDDGSRCDAPADGHTCLDQCVFANVGPGERDRACAHPGSLSHRDRPVPVLEGWVVAIMRARAQHGLLAHTRVRLDHDLVEVEDPDAVSDPCRPLDPQPPRPVDADLLPDKHVLADGGAERSEDGGAEAGGEPPLLEHRVADYMPGDLPQKTTTLVVVPSCVQPEIQGWCGHRSQGSLWAGLVTQRTGYITLFVPRGTDVTDQVSIARHGGRSASVRSEVPPSAPRAWMQCSDDRSNEAVELKGVPPLP